MIPTVSMMGRAWTAHSEGCRLTAYPDNGAYSIGYGHRGVPAGMCCSTQQAWNYLVADLHQAWMVLENAVTVTLSQGQVDALADFIFNEGAGRFLGSTLLKLLNAGNPDGASRELYWEDEHGPHGWIYAAGEINPGLIARRKGEQVLWEGRNPLADAQQHQPDSSPAVQGTAGDFLEAS